MIHWSSRLIKLKVCDEAAEWSSSQPSFKAAWAECERGDWMLWLLFKLKHPDANRAAFSLADHALRDAARALRSAAAVHPDKTHRAALESWADRLDAFPTIDSRAAAWAAGEAAWAARDPAGTARAAALGASDAAWAARDPAWVARNAALGASDPAWVASDPAWVARNAAWAAELKRQSDWLRENVTMPTLDGEAPITRLAEACVLEGNNLGAAHGCTGPIGFERKVAARVLDQWRESERKEKS
jgi:hypothetical protein